MARAFMRLSPLRGLALAFAGALVGQHRGMLECL